MVHSLCFYLFNNPLAVRSWYGFGHNLSLRQHIQNHLALSCLVKLEDQWQSRTSNSDRTIEDVHLKEQHQLLFKINTSMIFPTRIAIKVNKVQPFGVQEI